MLPVVSVSKLPYDHYDLVVIGAGPAGLCVANHPLLASKKVLIVDSGKSLALRDREDPNDLTCGAGGAGLFSDGKFSFFPSSTALWFLDDLNSLTASYNWTTGILEKYGMKVPSFPDSAPNVKEPEGQWFLKHYPSEYLSLEQRTNLIQELVEQGNGNILNQAMVEGGEYSVIENVFDLCISDQVIGTTHHILADQIIFATGRYGPRMLDQFPFIIPMFRRLEVGFRIQQPAEQAFFRECEQLDPKFKFIDSDSKTEWRTFCACRDGEAVLSNTLGMWTVSGRSDCPPTGMTNIGFNTRILDEHIAKLGWRHLERTFQKQSSHYNFAVGDILNRRGEAFSTLIGLMGWDLAKLMLRGLDQLVERFPSVRNPTTVLIGPTLEGVGFYPYTDENLKVPDVPAWVIGDCCGKFRGITASMISGFYSARKRIERMLKKEIPKCLDISTGTNYPSFNSGMQHIEKTNERTCQTSCYVQNSRQSGRQYNSTGRSQSKAKQQTDSIILGVGIVVTRCGRVALGRRLFPQPCWSLPGGKVEPLETIEECARRELYEETGLHGVGKTEILSVANIRISGLHTVTFGARFLECSGELLVCEPDKFTAWEWFDTNRLPDDLFLPSRIVLDCFMNRSVAYSEPSSICRFFEVDCTAGIKEVS